MENVDNHVFTGFSRTVHSLFTFIVKGCNFIKVDRLHNPKARWNLGVTGWVLVSVEVLGWFIKHSLLVFPCSIIWPCLCSIMELAAILISEAGLWLPTCFSAACSVSSATSLWLRIFRNTPTLLNQAEYRWWLLKLHGLCVRRNFCQSLSPLKVWASTGKQREQKL